MFTPEQEFEKTLYWCKGNEDAARFLMMAYEVTQVADDFVDRDVPDEEINARAMLKLLHLCMVDIPTNPFYQQHQQWYIPLMSTSFTIWSCTDEWKKDTNPTTQQFGYVYREICEQMVTITAQIVGGVAWARQVTNEAHWFYHQRDQETLKEWIDE